MWAYVLFRMLSGMLFIVLSLLFIYKEVIQLWNGLYSLTTELVIEMLAGSRTLEPEAKWRALVALAPWWSYGDGLSSFRRSTNSQVCLVMTTLTNFHN